MKNKGLLILMVAGMMAVLVGALFKLMHWPGGTLTLAFGMVLEAIALALLVVRSLSAPSSPNNNQDI
jgi:hypothetical protein